MGFVSVPPVARWDGELLPHLFTLAPPPLPAAGRSVLCDTFLFPRPAGKNPCWGSSFPAESGLSSPPSRARRFFIRILLMPHHYTKRFDLLLEVAAVSNISSASCFNSQIRFFPQPYYFAPYFFNRSIISFWAALLLSLYKCLASSSGVLPKLSLASMSAPLAISSSTISLWT